MITPVELGKPKKLGEEAAATHSQPWGWALGGCWSGGSLQKGKINV